MKLLNKIIFLLLIITTATSKAQEVFSSYANRIANAEFIFEGRVIQSTSYLVNDGKYINTSNTIEITKIFKGSLTCGTVEVITKGGDVGNWSVSSEHTLDLDEGAQGIFLCNNTDLELSTVDFYPETNSQKLEATFEDQSYVKYLDNGDELYASDTGFGEYETIKLSITNLAGNVVISKPIQVSDTKSLELDLTNLNTGMYFITLENKQQRITSKLIKL